MAGDPLDLRVVESVDDDLVIWPEQMEPGADRPGRAALGPAEDPSSEQKNDCQRPGSDDETQSPHNYLAYDIEKTRADALYLVEHAAPRPDVTGS